MKLYFIVLFIMIILGGGVVIVYGYSESHKEKTEIDIVPIQKEEIKIEEKQATSTTKTIDFRGDNEIDRENIKNGFKIISPQGDICEITYKAIYNSQTIDLSKLNEGMDFLPYRNGEEWINSFNVPSIKVTGKDTTLLDFQFIYNLNCSSKLTQNGNMYHSGNLEINFDKLTQEYSTEGVKPQAYDIIADKENVIATLKTNYKTSINLNDRIVLDPTYTITNLSFGAVLQGVTCEEGGLYCHLSLNNTQNLLAYYPMDAVQSPFVKRVTGKVGKAMLFENSSKQFLACAWQVEGNARNILPAYRANNTNTYMFWVKPAKNDSGMIYDDGYGIVSTDYGIMIGLDKNGKIVYDDCPSRNGFFDTMSTGLHVYQIGIWMHVAIVVNDTGVSFFINGTYYNSTNVIRVAAGAQHEFVYIGGGSGTNAYFGQYGIPSQRFFNGTLDEFRMWQRDLSAAEILDIYRNESNGVVDANMNQTKMAFWYSFDEQDDKSAVINDVDYGDVGRWMPDRTQSCWVNDSVLRDWTGNGYDLTYGIVEGGTIDAAQASAYGRYMLPSLNYTSKYNSGLEIIDIGSYTLSHGTHMTTKGTKHLIGINTTMSASVWINPKNTNGTIMGDDGVIHTNEAGWLVSLASPWNYPGTLNNQNDVYFCSGDNSLNLITTSATGACANTSGDLVPDGTWTHILVTKDRQMNYIYINGVLKSSKNVTTPGIQYAHTDTGFTIGSSGYALSYFNGTIDEVMIWNRTLTAAEALSVYQETYPRFVNSGNLSLNMTTRYGYEYTQINSTNLNQNRTNLSAIIKNYNYATILYSPSQNLSNGTLFSTQGIHRMINLTFSFLPDQYQFFSPILLKNITVDFINPNLYNIGPNQKDAGIKWGGSAASIMVDNDNIVHTVAQGLSYEAAYYCNNSGGVWSCLDLHAIGGLEYPTDIDIDSNGIIHVVSYGAAASYPINYCNNSGNIWSCHPVRPSFGGRYNSIGVDKSNNNIILATSGGYSGASAANIGWCNNSNSIQDFNCSYLITSLTTVDSIDLAISSDNKGYIVGTSSTGLKFCNSSANFAAWKCNTTAVAAAEWASIALDSNNNFHIAYSNTTAVKYCNGTFSTFYCSDIAVTSYGSNTAIDVDENNNIWVAYADEWIGGGTNGILRLCNKTLGGDTWNCGALNSFLEYSDGYAIGEPSSNWITLRSGGKNSNSYLDDIHYAFQQQSNHSTSGVLWYGYHKYKESSTGPDEIFPSISLIAPTTGKNVTYPERSFNATATDNVNASNMTFYLWFLNTTLVNTTTIFTSGTSIGVNLTVLLYENNTYNWNYYGCDNSNNCAFASVNYTLNYTYVEILDTCTYSGSGDWEVDCGDDCTITTNTDLGGNDLLLTGTGTEIFTIDADIININQIIESKCRKIVIPGRHVD